MYSVHLYYFWPLIYSISSCLSKYENYTLPLKRKAKLFAPPNSPHPCVRRHTTLHFAPTNDDKGRGKLKSNGILNLPDVDLAEHFQPGQLAVRYRIPPHGILSLPDIDLAEQFQPGQLSVGYRIPPRLSILIHRAHF